MVNQDRETNCCTGEHVVSTVMKVFGASVLYVSKGSSLGLPKTFQQRKPLQVFSNIMAKKQNTGDGHLRHTSAVLSFMVEEDGALIHLQLRHI